LFFAWHQGAMATAETVIIWFLILGTVFSFWRVKRLAGILLLPYLAWVTFATALCFATWRLNPGALGG
jgi:tryptophan-rich sensory protein